MAELRDLRMRLQHAVFEQNSAASMLRIHRAFLNYSLGQLCYCTIVPLVQVYCGFRLQLEYTPQYLQFVSSVYAVDLRCPGQ